MLRRSVAEALVRKRNKVDQGEQREKKIGLCDMQNISRARPGSHRSGCCCLFLQAIGAVTEQGLHHRHCRQKYRIVPTAVRRGKHPAIWPVDKSRAQQNGKQRQRPKPRGFWHGWSCRRTPRGPVSMICGWMGRGCVWFPRLWVGLCWM